MRLVNQQSPFTPLKNGVHLMKIASSRNGRRWVPTFVGMIGLVLVGCNSSVADIAETKTVRPTQILEKPASGSIQCYTKDDGPDAPSIAFSFNEESSTAVYLMDETQKFEAEFNAASIFLNYDRHNIMDTDRCQWAFNRLTGDGGLYCMLAETDTYIQEMSFKCQPFGKRKF